MNEEILMREAEAGTRARQLLSDEIFKSAIVSVETQIIDELKSADTSQPDKALDLVRKLQCCDQFVGEIQRKIASGKMAETALRMNTEKERPKFQR